MPPADTFIKPFSIERFKSALTWALLLSMLFVVMRVLATMGGRQWQLLLPLGFVLMTLVPWLLLTNAYRRRIGLAGATHLKWCGVATVADAVAASLCYRPKQIITTGTNGEFTIPDKKAVIAKIVWEPRRCESVLDDQ